MKLPTKKQAKGYDILIWIDAEGDVVGRSYTESGTTFLKGIDSRYREGDVLEIEMQPEDFKTALPRMLSVGTISPRTNKVTKMSLNRLQ